MAGTLSSHGMRYFVGSHRCTCESMIGKLGIADSRNAAAEAADRITGGLNSDSRNVHTLPEACGRRRGANRNGPTFRDKLSSRRFGIVRLKGKVVLVTGGASGMGRVATRM